MTLHTEKLLGADPNDSDTHLSAGDKRKPTGEEHWTEQQVDWNRWNKNHEPRRRTWIGKLLRRVKRLITG